MEVHIRVPNHRILSPNCYNHTHKCHLQTFQECQIMNCYSLLYSVDVILCIPVPYSHTALFIKAFTDALGPLQPQRDSQGISAKANPCIPLCLCSPVTLELLPRCGHSRSPGHEFYTRQLWWHKHPAQHQPAHWQAETDTEAQALLHCQGLFYSQTSGTN